MVASLSLGHDAACLPDHSRRTDVFPRPTGEQRFFGQLLRSIHGHSERPTVVFISHRFSTVRQADTILRLDEERIRAQGSHEELMRSDASYAELFEAQARWYR
jgi:ATP-binding cassette subfamily B protein